MTLNNSQQNYQKLNLFNECKFICLREHSQRIYRDHKMLLHRTY